MTAPSLEDIASFAALHRAFRRARRGQRGRAAATAFYANLEEELLDLSDSLLAGRWRPAPYRYLRLRNRKERLVSEASFRDRVVHHALVAALEPVWEAVFWPRSYACRVDRGSHRAVVDVQRSSRRYAYALRMDVKRYFDAIDHDVLLTLLGRRVDDARVLTLCERLLTAAAVPTVPAGSRRGVPIGNLTSQFWANVYLDPLDWYAVGVLGASDWARYMDDVVAFADEKSPLWHLADAVDDLARDELRLEMKRRATVVAPVSEGVAWLGTRVFPGCVRLDGAGRRRFARKVRRIVARGGEGVGPREVASLTSLTGHVAHVGTRALRRSLARDCPASGRPGWA